MPLSDTALREIAKVLRKHVAPRTLDEIAAELVEIRGDKDFRDTIERLVHALRIVSDRWSVAVSISNKVPMLCSVFVVARSLNDFFEVFAPVIGDGEQALCLSSMPVA
jgi:hypothetical protein